MLPEYIAPFSSVGGRDAAKRTRTSVAAGSHNILMIGLPGAAEAIVDGLVVIAPNENLSGA